ncbi:hypothetical protein NQD34_013579 [Periophthalmus magnuspinnatus]|nr:hypothetical protein NQD34_013579 [Periophthalmus magnuspinnatus]
MRQKINEHFPFTTGSTLQNAVSQPTLAPAAFNANQNNTLCLPLMSENHKIIWVYSDQVSIQGDKVAKLDEAFSRFPYLTQKETTSLAHSCSLHPDLVKVWFMAQRLRYGISWDSKDIHKVRRKMLGEIVSKKELHKCENETMKNLSREDEEEVASHSCIIKKEILSNAAIGNQMNTEKKPRGRKSKVLKKKDEVFHLNVTKISQMPWPKTETPETNSHPFLSSCSKPDIALLQESDENCFAIPDQALDRSPSVTFQVTSTQTSLVMEQEQMETNPQHAKKKMFTQEPPTCSSLDGSVVKKQGLSRRRRLNGRIKTPKQLAFMKMEFVKYQYPSDEQYREMSLLTGVPREGLIQWFSDMRYLIKKTKPTWLSVKQHERAVANVIHEQYIRKMKMQNIGSVSSQRNCEEVT